MPPTLITVPDLGPQPARPSNTELSTATSPGSDFAAHYEQVCGLADQGLDESAIVRETGLLPERVAWILGLKRQWAGTRTRPGSHRSQAQSSSATD